jgi:L-threonylcarbamoyladenylate synthase
LPKQTVAEIGKDIEHAKELLENGELVGIPTETVYGLAGNATDASVVAKIFAVKDRPSFDPIIVHVASVSAASDLVADLDGDSLKLINRFWPGPLTLLLPKKSLIPDLVTAGLDRVGIRCPDHPLALQLLKQLSFPLAAPSANPFGYVSPTNAQHVQDQLGNKIEYILDGGPCNVGIESTIIGWEEGKAVIYRAGGIIPEQIEDLIGKVHIRTHSTSRPQAPGQLKSHYSPRKKFVLGNLGSLFQHHKNERKGILSFKGFPGISENQLILSRSGDLQEAARNLFAMLRMLDSMQIDIVLAEEVPNTGLGKAINDRLRRAAANTG